MKAAAKEVRKSSHLNLAAVQLKKQQWKEVVQNCEKVGEPLNTTLGPLNQPGPDALSKYPGPSQGA